MSQDPWGGYQGPRKLDQPYARELFDCIDGDLYWRNRPSSHFKNCSNSRVWCRRFAETRAGTLPNYSRPKKHRRVTIDGRAYYLARVVWLYHMGEWPEYCWHINGDRQNCVLENLESMTREQHFERLEQLSRYLALRRVCSETI